MNSGVVGAIALLLVGGALYLGSTYLGDYFEERNAAMAPAALDETVDEANQSVEESAETAANAVSEAVGDAAEGVEDAVEGVVDAIAESTEETSAAIEEGADEMASLAEDAAQDAGEAADTALGALDRDSAETASEPGTTPVLDVVRIEPNGEVVIAGNAPQGERVGLTYNDEVIAEADVEEGGDFVLVPGQPIPQGEGTLGVVVIDGEGNRESQSDEQVAVVLPDDGSEDGFLVSVLRPGQPVEIIERVSPELTETPDIEIATRIEPASEQGTEQGEAPQVEIASRIEPDAQAETPEPFVVVDAIELEGQNIWIAGAAPPGTVIRLYQDNQLLGQTVTGEEGRYLFEGSLSDASGEVTVRADALATSSADVVARAEVPFEMPMVEAPVETAQAPAEQTEQPAAEQVATEQAPAEQPATEQAPAEQAETEQATDGQAVDEQPDAPALEIASTITPESSTENEQSATPNGEPQVETAAAAPDGAQALPQPADANVRPADARISVLDTGRVIIRRGDNLWRLSRRVYGQGIRYTSIYDANRDQIRDPALIFPGQVFELPTPEAEWGEVPGIDALEPDQIPEGAAVSN